MSKILIIEDDAGLSGNISNWLEFQGHTPETAADSDEAMHRVKESTYDFIILDWELPGAYSGPDICREIRNRKIPTPVLLLTCRATLDDKVLAFDAGVDDYLTKPFALQELGSRMKALMRRPAIVLDSVMRVGNIELDPNTRNVKVDGVLVSLSPLEFGFLELLMRHPNVVFTTEAIFERIWPSSAESSLDVVRTHVKTLRKKLSPDDPAKAPLKNVYGGGYKLEQL